jgi:hypothetical protein
MRYTSKQKDYQTYTDFYRRYKMASNILNQSGTPDINSVFFDKVNIKTELLTRIGDQYGKYQRGGSEMTAYLPYLNKMLEIIEERFKAHQKQRLNAGYAEPTEMPRELLKEKLNYEARLDITNVEIEFLAKRLKTFTDVEEAKTDGEVLQFGCVASCHFHGTQALTIDLINILKEIDGQKIGQTSSGLLIIRDERSPYNGMSVADYRGTICNQFLAERKALDRERLKKLKALAREEGLPIPHQLSPRGPVKVSKSSLPKWPDSVRNYITEPETEDSSGTIMKRTKSK